MSKYYAKLATPAYLFKMTAQYEPAYIIWSVLQIITAAVLPLLYVYAPKLIIEALTDGRAFTDVLRIILLYGIVLLVLNLCSTVFGSKSALAADCFTKKLRYEIGKVTMSLPLSEIECASTAETVNLAKNVSDITETMSYIGRIVSNIITIAGLIYIIARIDIICMLSVFAVVALKSLFTCVQFRYKTKARLLSAQNERVGNYLYGLAYFNRGAEKELRVGNLQNWFMAKIKAYRYRMVRLQYHDFRYSALFESIIAIVMAVQSFILLFILADDYTSGSISIADFTMIFAAVTSLTAALSAFSDQISQYNRQVMNASDYKKLMSLRADDNDGVTAVKTVMETGVFNEVVFDNVCFTYPGTNTPALKNVSIRVGSGEKLAIVGRNGAGKSTFIKLLCKFYKPTSGEITLNGINIQSIPNSRYYKLLGTVFQDYSSFAFSIRENITFSEEEETEKVISILRELGMNCYAEKADTYITKNFSPEGIEPSGGEEQKLAIARAIYKNAPLLILDEPTASLDVKAESEIYKNLFHLAKERTTIFISHRLAVSTMADHIAVFENGRIVEYGSHLELIKRKGLYTGMYEKQSRPYVDSKNVF